MRRCCFRWCPTPCPGSPACPRPRRLQRHRRAPSVGALAGRARAATALGAVGAAAVAAAAIPVGAFFTALDAARETTQGRAALDALTPGLWAGALSLLLLGLVGVLCAALY